jgi:hypothetical protein
MRNIRMIMQGLISLVLLGAGLYGMFGHDIPPETHKWAYGMIGTLIGFWFRGR